MAKTESFRGINVSLLKNIFNSNQRELRRLEPIVRAVGALESRMMELSDDQLASMTSEFRRRAHNGEPPDRMLPEAFAVVREVSRRVLDMRHFDVQIMGGVVLWQGRIAEMQTGEGKTLVATLPSYLTAVSGGSVHIVTVNDYLAGRDREWMGQIHRFLGLDVGLVVPGMNTADKRRSYSCPIIYGTNTEFGFDYLRDNMAYSGDGLAQGPLEYAIVDEVDSILIDEARTPLIISGPSEGSTDAYRKFQELARVLSEDLHYTVDEKARIVVLTEEGDERAEAWLGLKPGELNSLEHIGNRAYINQALRAKELMKRDVDYVIKDGEVLIVDEFTGRILPGRRYSDGLHQAIEAKEGVRVREETDTLATITVQNFFRMYRKLSGMTGTALTEEAEFQEIYGLDVVSIPTNKPLIRDPLPDSVWRTEHGKFRAVVDEIAECHQKGQPVLVGTRSIERSEMLSGMLAKRGIPHEVLNAKHHEREAEIVAQAGRMGAVTIATNMAGRGTDILLGGNSESMSRNGLRREGFEPEIVLLAAEKVLPQSIAKRIEEGHEDEFLSAVMAARKRYSELYSEARKVTGEEHDRVVELGGLHVLGTERHEARRIDNQLRGRAGRQGDPGSSRFYLSLEDELMRLFGGDLLTSLMDRIGMEEDEAIEHGLVTRAIETAQKRVESQNFSIRKNVLEYDNILNKQRSVIYGDRRKILESQDLVGILGEMTGRVIQRAVELHWPYRSKKEEADLEGLWAHVRELSGVQYADREEFKTPEDIASFLGEAFDAALEERHRLFGDNLADILRVILLRNIDRHWVEHLRAMDGLREGIGLQAYGQRDPLVEYTRQGFDMFQARLQSIEEDTVRMAYRLAVVTQDGTGEEVRKAVPKPQAGQARQKPSAHDDGSKRTAVRKGPKVGRNEPCPCGSGKKYKNCCGKL